MIDVSDDAKITDRVHAGYSPVSNRRPVSMGSGPSEP
jgi:hypothetical protein